MKQGRKAKVAAEALQRGRAWQTDGVQLRCACKVDQFLGGFSDVACMFKICERAGTVSIALGLKFIKGHV